MSSLKTCSGLRVLLSLINQHHSALTNERDSIGQFTAIPGAEVHKAFRILIPKAL